MLYLDDNNITDVAPLAGMSSLEYLFIRNNPVTDFSPLSHIDSLQIER